MAKKSSRPAPLPFRAGRRKSLIEWNDPSTQVHLLDWRRRAHEFGLDVEEREDTEGGQPFQVAPEQLLAEEEPEAFTAQPVPGRDDDAEDEEPEVEGAALPGSREDVDLVRVYLQHIGKRKLLKAKDEQAIGLRIENAQKDLVAALGDIPGAVQTLVALADRIRTKGDPAAELILRRAARGDDDAGVEGVRAYQAASLPARQASRTSREPAHRRQDPRRHRQEHHQDA